MFNRNISYFSSVRITESEKVGNFSEDRSINLEDVVDRRNFPCASTVVAPRKSDSALEKFVCPVCGRKLTNSSNYQYHLRTHSGEKPFTCHTCQKSFRNKGNLKVHLITHTKTYQKVKENF